MSREPSKFVRTGTSTLHKNLIAAYDRLFGAVNQAEDAVVERLETYNRLMNPKRAAGTSTANITRDNNQRKYDFVVAVHRERAAFEPLCSAMEGMHLILSDLNTDITDPNSKIVDEHHKTLLKINFVECCKLYRRAVAVLSRFDSTTYEISLDVHLDQEVKAASAWFEGMPHVMLRHHRPNVRREHQPLALYAQCLSSVDRDDGGPLKGGFLGEVMYATDIKKPTGAVCISVDREDSGAAHEVMVSLRQRGYQVEDDNCGSIRIERARKGKLNRKIHS